jgi:hypothetical protein
MNLKIKQDYCILVDNYSDWIDIQKYLFSIDINWMGFSNKIFTKFYYKTSKSSDIIFPRYLVINYFEDERQWVMWNTGNHKLETISKPNNGPVINATTILRKKKILKIEASK